MAAIDIFKGVNPDKMLAPSNRSFEITPDDDNELAFVTRQVWVGTGGDLHYQDQHGTSATLKNIPNGTMLNAIRIKKVFEDSTADDLIGWV